MLNKEKMPLDKQQFKAFGLLMTWAFPLFFGVVVPLIFSHDFQWWTLYVSGFFLTLSMISPQLLYLPYRVWMLVGGVIGWINTRLILGVTFYVLIFPISVVLRILGKLQYTKGGNSQPNKTSNYIKRTEKLDKNQLEHPF